MIPDLEEMTFFPQSEALNCLAEAMPYAAAARGEIPVHGEGEFEFQVSEPVYCRATDAFAGMLTTAIYRFRFQDEMLEEMHRQQTENYKSHGEDHFTITKGAPEAPRPAELVAAGVDSEEIPF